MQINFFCPKLFLIFAVGVIKPICSMWEEKNNALHRVFEFRDFSEAFGFMTRVALVAEKLNHHPKWTNTWNRVELWLNTHDAGNVVTEKDLQLAEAIDELL